MLVQHKLQKTSPSATVCVVSQDSSRHVKLLKACEIVRKASSLTSGLYKGLWLVYCIDKALQKLDMLKSAVYCSV